MFDITAIGEILIDLTQSGVNEQGIPVYTANPGGAPANVSVAASKLGAKTAFIGKVGNDAFGKQLTACLAENGVDTRGIVTDSTHPTTQAVVSVDESGERHFSFYRGNTADTELSYAEVSKDILSTSKIVHFGSVSLTHRKERQATVKAVKYAKKAGALISYDPNYRERLWKTEDEAVREMRACLKYADILKVSDEELYLLSATTDFEKAVDVIRKTGPKLIFVTMGEKGAFYAYGSLSGTVPAYPCKVADTNGAGDTFFGAALTRLSKLTSLSELTGEKLEDIVRFANRAASITTSRPGAIPAMPSLTEVEESGN